MWAAKIKYNQDSLSIGKEKIKLLKQQMDSISKTIDFIHTDNEQANLQLHKFLFYQSVDMGTNNFIYLEPILQLILHYYIYYNMDVYYRFINFQDIQDRSLLTRFSSLSKKFYEPFVDTRNLCFRIPYEEYDYSPKNYHSRHIKVEINIYFGKQQVCLVDNIFTASSSSLLSTFENEKFGLITVVPKKLSNITDVELRFKRNVFDF